MPPLTKAQNAQKSKDYRLAHPERVRKTAQKAWLKYRETVDPKIQRRTRRKYHLTHTFGMTLEEYDRKLVAQNGVCAVCRRPETKIYRGALKSLDVDHCHRTNKIRDLLCGACNSSLGLLGEDALRIRALADYIERHNGE